MDVNTYYNTDGSRTVVLRLHDLESQAARSIIFEQAVKLAAEHIAAVFIEQHQNDILAKLDPQAVANLAVAASGAAVRDVLGRALPATERVITRTEVYQRGVFGGLRRL